MLLRRISDRVVALTAKYGGLMWGARQGLPLRIQPRLLRRTLGELQRVKGAFDPQNRVSPARSASPYGGGAGLVSVDGPKRGKFDRQIPLAVRTSYTRALDCNGNGLCFTFETDSPCALGQNKRDRRHSPRGGQG